MAHAQTCPICGGSGKLPDVCHGCGGKGWVEVADEMPVGNWPWPSLDTLPKTQYTTQENK